VCASKSSANMARAQETKSVRTRGLMVSTDVAGAWRVVRDRAYKVCCVDRVMTDVRGRGGRCTGCDHMNMR
jgi:hypothetical protein